MQVITASDYQAQLLTILRQHSAQALSTLRAFDAALPEKAQAATIMVHGSQDADGLFTIMFHLSGPDLHVLNKAIEGCRVLFETRFTERGIDPPVPTFDPNDPPFEINDAIVDAAFVWLGELWRDFGGTTRAIPVLAMGEDGYGTRNRVALT